MRLDYQEDLRSCSEDKIVMVMDYAQNLPVPHNPQTPSKWHFLSLIYVSLFGIYYGNDQKHYNYVYSERVGSKGSNEVVSIIQNFLMSKGLLNHSGCPTKTLVIFCDNCGGQNKNNTVIKYALLLANSGFFFRGPGQILCQGAYQKCMRPRFWPRGKGLREGNCVHYGTIGRNLV